MHQSKYLRLKMWEMPQNGDLFFLVIGSSRKFIFEDESFINSSVSPVTVLVNYVQR